MPLNISVCDESNIGSFDGWKQVSLNKYSELVNTVREYSYSASVFKDGKRDDDSVVASNNILIYSIKNQDDKNGGLSMPKAESLFRDSGVTTILLPTGSNKNGAYRILIPVAESLSDNITPEAYRKFQELVAKELDIFDYLDKEDLFSRSRYYPASPSYVKPIFVSGENQIDMKRLEAEAVSLSSESNTAPTPDVQTPEAKETEVKDSRILDKKRFLVVPFEDKDRVKELGGKWDDETKLWTVPEGTLYADVKSWLPENREIELMGSNTETTYSTMSELEDAMAELGLDGRSVHIDLSQGSKWRRIPLIGKGSKNKDGAYKVNGHAGEYRVTFVNHVTEERKTWFEKNTNYKKMSKAEWKLKNDLARAKQAEADEAMVETYIKTAGLIAEEFNQALPANPRHPYLVRKQIGVYDLRREKNGTLLIPLCDKDGLLWSVQRIWENGEKRGKMYGKRTVNDVSYPSKKEGLFYVVGASHDSIKSLDRIILVEGFATGASLQQALGEPVVMTLDKGNLKTVARIFAETYPKAELIIAGDNDAGKELYGKVTNGRKPVNEGKKATLEIRDELGATIALPQFNEQDTKNGMSDWNDLMLSEGRETVIKQFNDAVDESRRENAKTFELTDTYVTKDSGNPESEKLYKIKATKDFVVNEKHSVAEGQEGGWVEDRACLEDGAWVQGSIEVCKGVTIKKGTFLNSENTFQIKDETDVVVAKALTSNKEKRDAKKVENVQESIKQGK